MVSPDIDLTRYLELIHSSPPDKLAQLLDDLLSDPEARLEQLRVFVPEVCLLLSRLLITQDLEGATALSRALEATMATRDLNVDSAGYIGAGLSARAGQLFSYFLGRLRSLLVLARRVPVLDVPEHVLVEAQDGGENEAILRILADRGATPVRNLRQALRNELPEGMVPSLEELHRKLARLVKSEVVALDRNRRILLYSLSPLGRRLLEEPPPWISAVAEVYRAYRRGGAGALTPHARKLEDIFRSIDEEPVPVKG